MNSMVVMTHKHIIIQSHVDHFKLALAVLKRHISIALASVIISPCPNLWNKSFLMCIRLKN